MIFYIYRKNNSTFLKFVRLKLRKRNLFAQLTFETFQIEEKLEANENETIAK
jgi:hypothetical protein